MTIPRQRTAQTNANKVGFAGATPVMPMRWLYVLADSQLVVPTSTDGINITVPGHDEDRPELTGQTVPNPMVGGSRFGRTTKPAR